MIDDILDCPFCGSECSIETTTFGDSMREYFRVGCKSPDNHTLDSWQDTPSQAVIEWNKRPLKSSKTPHPMKISKTAEGELLIHKPDGKGGYINLIIDPKDVECLYTPIERTKSFNKLNPSIEEILAFWEDPLRG